MWNVDIGIGRLRQREVTVGVQGERWQKQSDENELSGLYIDTTVENMLWCAATPTQRQSVCGAIYDILSFAVYMTHTKGDEMVFQLLFTEVERCRGTQMQMSSGIREAERQRWISDRAVERYLARGSCTGKVVEIDVQREEEVGQGAGMAVSSSMDAAGLISCYGLVLVY